MYKAYCFDLDGTIYRGKAGIESAVQFVHHLQAQGIEPFYLTNNSSKTRETLQQMLVNIGITAPLTAYLFKLTCNGKICCKYE